MELVSTQGYKKRGAFQHSNQGSPTRILRDGHISLLFTTETPGERHCSSFFLSIIIILMNLAPTPSWTRLLCPSTQRDTGTKATSE